MSQPDRLFRRIHEYYDLLGFLFKEHPQILQRWKSKSGLRPTTTSEPDADAADVNNPGEGNAYKRK